MNFELTQEEKELKRIYTEYAEDRLRPHALEIDRGDTAMYSTLKKEVHELGFCGIIIPEEYGGLGSTFSHYVIAVEALAYGCSVIGKAVGGQSNMCYPILNYGTETQKRDYVTAWVKGEKASAFTLTEPGAGSDANAIRTSAVKEGEKYIINGTKSFISGASEADFFQTYCVVYDEHGKKLPICLLVDKNELPGITIGKNEELMGMHSCSVSEVVFDDVPVHESKLVGKIGEGFHVAMSTLDAGRLGISAVCVGMAQDAIDMTVKYTSERMQFGKRISQFQNTKFKLAELQTKTNAARLMVYNAASKMDNKLPAATDCAMAKYLASETLNFVVRECLQLHGGYGYCKDYPIEKLFRDAKITELFEGTSEIQKLIISRAMGIR